MGDEGGRRPDDIATSVVCLPEGSRVEHLDDGAVVWAPGPRSLHRLNVAGATVLAELDGERSVVAIADHIAAALRIDPAPVRDDCMRLAAALVDAGVLVVLLSAAPSPTAGATVSGAGSSGGTRPCKHGRGSGAPRIGDH